MSKEIEVVFIKEKKGHFKLGQTKSVKAGYALNYLLPFEWAIRNTKGLKLKIDAIAKEESILNKSGYTLTPFISNFYPKSVNKLTYYFESYNTKK